MPKVACKLVVDLRNFGENTFVAEINGSLPPAGWHPDPADAAMERWWSGMEWSAYSRPKETAAASPVSAPTEPNFAAHSEPAFARAGASSFGAGANPFGTAGTTSPPPANNSMFENYVEERSIEQDKVSASWYDPNFRGMIEPPARNGKATAALVLGIISFLTAPLSLITLILTFVLSNLALNTARLSELSEKRPVGRARAQWAIFFGVLAIIWTAVAGYFGYTYYQDYLI